MSDVRESRGRAIAYRLGAAGGFAVMAAFIKIGADAGIATIEMMFWRFAVGLVPLFAYIALRSSLRVVRTERFGAHAGRAAIGLASMYLSFRGLALLPLAEATTISFAAPLFAIAMSALLLGERVGPRRWTAVAAGFVGVLVVAAPSGHALPLDGVFYAVGGALGVASVTIAIRRIGSTEAPETTVFWFTSLALLALLPLMPAAATPHDLREWGILAVIGLAGGASQLLMTRSIGLAHIGIIAPFDYSQLLWAGLLGFIVWGSVPSARTLLGAAIIAACGIYSAWREHQLARAAEARPS